MPELLFDWLDDGVQNDDRCTITLDGRPVATITHDDHGWDGMTAVRDALVEVARLQGWDVRILGSEGV
jgi:hypothetical protein